MQFLSGGRGAVGSSEAGEGVKVSSTAAYREREVQAAVIRFYQTLGCEVVRFAEGRRTRITPGWPDLAVFHLTKKAFWVHECKRQGGKQSGQQHIVELWCQSCGVPYILGGVQAASDHLTELGILP